MSKAMLVDLTRCIGCRTCQIACKQWNDLPAEVTHNQGTYENPPRRSAKTWTIVEFSEIEAGDRLAWVFAKRQCMHCEYPSCASACPAAALTKRPDGPVVYDSNKCIGCRYCMIACPFRIPTFEWDKPIPYIRKCTFCVDRMSAGLTPACAKACPTGTLLPGEREELLEIARTRIYQNPDQYVHHIYGEHEAGGTGWLYISRVPFEQLGFPNVGTVRYTELAWTFLSAVPVVLIIWPALLMGAYAFTQRREMLAQAESKEEVRNE